MQTILPNFLNRQGSKNDEAPMSFERSSLFIRLGVIFVALLLIQFSFMPVRPLTDKEKRDLSKGKPTETKSAVAIADVSPIASSALPSFRAAEGSEIERTLRIEPVMHRPTNDSVAAVSYLRSSGVAYNTLLEYKTGQTLRQLFHIKATNKDSIFEAVSRMFLPDFKNLSIQVLATWLIVGLLTRLRHIVAVCSRISDALKRFFAWSKHTWRKCHECKD